MKKTIQQTIGANIRTYRKRQGLSQKELGALVGVTSQAVSNWECGGLPNAELLPTIAEILKVSISALFAEEEIQEESLYDRLVREFASLNTEEQLQRAFALCYAVLISLHVPYTEETAPLFLPECSPASPEKKNYVYAKIEQGYVYGCLNDKEKYLFAMPEPEGGYRADLLSEEQYLDFFGQFADIDYFRILLFFFSRKNIPLTQDVLVEKSHVKPDKAEKILSKLERNGWLIQEEVCTDGKQKKIYRLVGNYAFLTFLLTAKDLLVKKEDYTTYIGVNDRLGKSLLN